MDPFARKMWRSGIGFAVSLLVLVSGLKLFSMHEWPTCPDTLISETASPGKQFIAAILQRRCGTEAPYVTRVNLRPKGPLIRGFLSWQVKQGTIFVLEQDAAGAGITVSWAEQNTLTIHCPHCDPALGRQRDQQWGPVIIHYQVP